jgi:hypothetical protein
MISATQAAGWEWITSRLPACEAEVWEYLFTHPCRTRNEIDRDLGHGQPNCQASRRLAAMERKGVVSRSATYRACTVTGRRCETWWAVEASHRPVPKPVPLKRRFAQMCAELHALTECQMYVTGSAVCAIVRRYETTEESK